MLAHQPIHSSVNIMIPSRLKFLPVLLVLLLGAAPAPAQPAGGATKVGLVNIQEAITNTTDGKKEFETIQRNYAPKQAELKRLNDEVEKLKTQLQAPGGGLSETQRTQQAKDLQAKQAKLQSDFEAAQNQFQQAEQAVLTRLGQKMLQVLETFAEANGYDLILDVSNPQTPVLWGARKVIITQDLIKAYDAEAAAAPAVGSKP